jgi:predicted DNA-binding protein
MPNLAKNADRATSIHLPSDVLERVDALARYEGISRSSWVRRLILVELRAAAQAPVGDS